MVTGSCAALEVVHMTTLLGEQLGIEARPSSRWMMHWIGLQPTQIDRDDTPLPITQMASDIRVWL